MNIAVIGSEGYVGSSLLRTLMGLSDANVQAISRNNFQQFSKVGTKHSFDLIVYAASPAGRLRAESQPEWDFQETVKKSQWFLKNYRFGLIILISTVSVSLAPKSTYALHRKVVEEEVLDAGGNVVRLGPLYGGKKRISTLQEIVESRPVFFSSETRYSYTNVNSVSEYLSNHLYSLPKLQEIGVCDSISLGEIAKSINSSSVFGAKLDHQEINECTISSKSTDVLSHIRKCMLENLAVG